MSELPSPSSSLAFEDLLTQYLEAKSVVAQAEQAYDEVAVVWKASLIRAMTEPGLRQDVVQGESQLKRLADPPSGLSGLIFKLGEGRHLESQVIDLRTGVETARIDLDALIEEEQNMPITDEFVVEYRHQLVQKAIAVEALAVVEDSLMAATRSGDVPKWVLSFLVGEGQIDFLERPYLVANYFVRWFDVALEYRLNNNVTAPELPLGPTPDPDSDDEAGQHSFDAATTQLDGLAVLGLRAFAGSTNGRGLPTFRRKLAS